MIVEETFYRPAELSREARTLPADIYNLAHHLLTRAGTGCLFVPIRSMQFLAVLDADEVIFVDREGRRLIELAWQRFAPQTRRSLEDPVPYEVVYYSPAAIEVMRRVHGEFYKALRELEQKTTLAGPGRVIKLAREKR
ncbi:MAG TPA: hypothetical protein VJ608_01930 [Albitalea sp.]|nr:hypothetical protein [Albitalea sp.]